MMPSLTNEFGNAASRIYPLGCQAAKMVDKAREQIAHFIGAESKEIIFTSGATESNNIALKGVFEIYREKGNHIITQVTEHKSVLDTCKYLEQNGAQVTYLPVDRTGQIRIDELEKSITDKTVLISIMFANNEVGTIQPITEIGKIAKKHGVIFHVDAAQALGKVPVQVESLGIDLLSCSAHKMYGPKGAGMLYVRRKNPRVRAVPLIHGGGHEEGMRSGTLNVPGIVGLGKACEISEKEMIEESKRLVLLRDRLKKGIESQLEEVSLNGHPTERLPNNLHLSFAYVEGEALLMSINEEIAISSGSACSSASTEPSYVLKALGLSNDFAYSSVRFGLGRFNTEEEVDYVIFRVVEAVKKLRAMSPLYQAVKQKTG
jgi:cysteine desulfurase